MNDYFGREITEGDSIALFDRTLGEFRMGIVLCFKRGYVVSEVQGLNNNVYRVNRLPRNVIVKGSK